jgi:hypothetical protein
MSSKILGEEVQGLSFWYSEISVFLKTVIFFKNSDQEELATKMIIMSLFLALHVVTGY